MAEMHAARMSLLSRGSGVRLIAKVLSLAGLVFVLAIGLASAQEGDSLQSSTPKPPPDRLLQPMKRLMDELGVTGTQQKQF